MTRIAFIGLGAMGFPMAGHLAGPAAKNLPVTVYNRTTAVSAKWISRYRGEVASSPAQAARNADVIITCLGNDDDVNEIYTQSVFDNMPANALLIDHTTTSATLAEDLAASAKKQGACFLDAPVSGGQSGAKEGILTIMVGGELEAFTRAKPIMYHYAKSITHIGTSGFGQRCKMVNQICAAGVLQGLAEGLILAKQVGIDAQTVLEALQHGAGSSWQMVNRTESMMKGEFDFGFAVDWMRKDLGICLAEAEKLGLTLPMTQGVDGAYALLQQAGHQRSDTSVLIKQFEHFKKLELFDQLKKTNKNKEPNESS